MLRRKSLVSTTLCAIILLHSLYIDKNLTQLKLHIIPNKFQEFQQNILKIKPFSSSRSHKGSISEFKFQNSNFSPAALRRFLAVKT